MDEWRKPLPEQVESWQRFGPAIMAEPRLTLAAFLDDAEAIAALEAAGLPAPVPAALANDPTMAEPSWMRDAEVEDDLLQRIRFVRRLALWGPGALVRAALAAADYQAERQPLPRGAMAQLRADMLTAVRAWVEDPAAPETLALACEAAARGQKKYRPHERNPDSPKAVQVWLELGAPWCAAEAAACDWNLTQWDGPGPREASHTWGNRLSVWPGRAVDAACECGSYAEVEAAIRMRLLAWTRSCPNGQG